MSVSSSYEQTREKVKADLQHRQSVEKDALAVVISLLETGIREEQLLEAANRLTPAHYGDVTEERGLAMLCGYPICPNRLTTLNHKQRYHISAMTNKVYDVSERRYFCSSFCYKASKYLQSQLSDEPLWGRDRSSAPRIELLTERKKQQATAVNDESVVIDKSMSFLGADNSTEVLASEILHKLTLEEKGELEEGLVDEKHSDSDSSDEGEIESIQSFLTRRKDQRLHTDLSNPTSAVGEVDERWQGSMLNRINGDQPVGQSNDSINLANRSPNKTLSQSVAASNRLTNQQASGNKSSPEIRLNQTLIKPQAQSARSAKPKDSPNVIHKTGMARAAKASAPRTVLLDCTMPAPKVETGVREEAETPADLLLCLERLTDWFTDETRQVIFNKAVLLPTSSLASTSQQADAHADTSGEVEVTQPNIESVESSQRSIVYQRLLKSFERLSNVVPEQNGFKDRLRPVVKTFRLTRENISAKPIQWSLCVLVLCICLGEASPTMTIKELERLTKDKSSSSTVYKFIQHQKQLLGG